MRILKWFYPGMGIKRWWSACIGGLLLFGFGLHLLLDRGHFIWTRASGVALLISGIVLELYALGKLSRSLLRVFLPHGETKFIDLLFKKRYLSRGPRITAMGGGTGLSVLLHGLKKYSSNLTAIVTVADDGGSSGRIRRDFNLPPPGDIRNCLVSLADAEPLMRSLFQYRFDDSTELKGHSFGNLFITALTKVTGDFEKAVEASSKVLAICGRVVPVTLKNVSLVGRHADGSFTLGEERISESWQPIEEIRLEPGGSRPTDAALNAIEESDAILMGPGSLYTSVIPNLLVDGLAEAIASSKAVKIYICNIMTQRGETRGYTASQHVEAISRHAGRDIIDYVICNREKIPQKLLVRYEKENASPVQLDYNVLREKRYRVIVEDLVNADRYIRHDSDRLAETVIDLIEMAMKEKGRHVRENM